VTTPAVVELLFSSFDHKRQLIRTTTHVNNSSFIITLLHSNSYLLLTVNVNFVRPTMLFYAVPRGCDLLIIRSSVKRCILSTAFYTNIRYDTIRQHNVGVQDDDKKAISVRCRC